MPCPLVEYENSDSSEYEDDDDDQEPALPTSTLITETEEPSDSESESTAEVPDPSHNGQSLFNLLPQPSTKEPEVEEDDEFLHKKAPAASIAKPKARITVPSLSDFKDVDSMPNKKPRAPSTKKSGLLSLLPQPRGAVISTATYKSLIPHVLTQKPSTSKVKQKPEPTQDIAETKASAVDYSDESDNEDGMLNDFFSINKPVELPPEDNIDILDIDAPKREEIEAGHTTKEKRDIQSYFKQDIAENPVELPTDSQMMSNQSEQSDYSSYEGPSESSSNNNVVLDDEALRMLCGSRGRRRREDIQIVEVDQGAVLAEARQAYLRGLRDDTSTRASASKRKGNEPTSQQKRKHQITYLAHQAKANEQELQNQWSQNRQSKRQTQSKYGF